MDSFPSGPRRQRLLVVCRVNVCRSPLTASELAYLLDPATFGPIETVSAGIRAKPGHAMCEISRAAASRRASGGRLAAEHRSRQIDAGMIRDAELVLTMSRDQRGQIARLLPGSQARTFTLVEAGLILAAVQDGVDSVDPRTGLGGLAELLAANRWRIAAGSLGRRGDALSIADGHVDGRGAHRATAEQVIAACENFARAASRVSRREYVA